jgi:hypothetical protein
MKLTVSYLSYFDNTVFNHPVALMYFLACPLFRLKCNLLSCPTSQSLHDLPVHDHHKVHVYLLFSTLFTIIKCTSICYSPLYSPSSSARLSVILHSIHHHQVHVYLLFSTVFISCSLKYEYNYLRVHLLLLGLVALLPFNSAWVICVLRNAYRCGCSVIICMLSIGSVIG